MHKITFWVARPQSVQECWCEPNFDMFPRVVRSRPILILKNSVRQRRSSKWELQRFYSIYETQLCCRVRFLLNYSGVVSAFHNMKPPHPPQFTFTHIA